MPILIIVFLITNRKNNLLRTLILSYNILLLLVLSFNFLLLLFDYYIIYIDSKKYEQDIFFKYRISTPFDIAYWLPVVFQAITFITLLIKKVRQSVLFAIILFLIQIILLNWEQVVIALTSWFGDHLPSSWPTYYYLKFELTSILVFSLALILTYWIRTKLTFTPIKKHMS